MYLQNAKNSCNQFKSLVGDKSCKAMSGTCGETSVSKYTVEAICKEVDGLLNPPAPAAPKGGTTAVKSLKNSFSVGVKDAAPFNKFLTSPDSTFIQQGKLVLGVSILSADTKVQMGCAKLNDSSAWAVQNLIDLFGATSKIKVLEAAAPADAQPEAGADIPAPVDQGAQ